MAGDADAQFILGACEAAVAASPADFARAADWYRRAAEHHHPLAEHNLGVMYAEGQGVDRNPAEAGRWLRRAAAHGDPGAQFAIGLRCQRAGLAGPAPDAAEARIEAYRWFCLAAEQGYAGADEARQRLSLGMTRAEMDEGARRATLNEPADAERTP